MIYETSHFWGMHFIWWILWLFMIFWIFAVPYDIPGQRRRYKDSPLDILQRRFAAGALTKEQYLEHKQVLDNKSK